MSVEQYRIEAAKLFTTVKKGFDELASTNPGMVVQVESGSLTIELPKNGGVYTLEQNTENAVVTMVSPFSGGYTYAFDTDNSCWMSDKDAHNILELLMRELFVVCNGCPAF